MDAKLLIDQAKKAAERHNFKVAQGILKELIRKDPKNVDAWLLLADVVENPEHSRQCLERVILLQPDHSEARQKLTRLNDPYSDLVAFSQGDEDLYGENVPEVEPGSTIHDESGDEAGTLGETALYIEPATIPEKGSTHALQKSTEYPPRPQKKRVQSQKKSSRWLEISLATMAVVCLCIVAVVVLGQNPSLLQINPQPTPESP